MLSLHVVENMSELRGSIGVIIFVISLVLFMNAIDIIQIMEMPLTPIMESDLKKFPLDMFCVNGNRVPNVFLLGTQKCGTTTLAFNLMSHDLIEGAQNCTASYMCRLVKEPFFFPQATDVTLHDTR